VEIYKAMGEDRRAQTGYPCTPVYDAFPMTDDQGRRATSGGFIEWTYTHKGILSFATELWDIKSRAGIERCKATRCVSSTKKPRMTASNCWSGMIGAAGNDGFVDWREFDHPQLGKVEIGGWKAKKSGRTRHLSSSRTNASEIAVHA
jgi:hypothetical protein